jgi:hypothetical protein
VAQKSALRKSPAAQPACALDHRWIELRSLPHMNNPLDEIAAVLEKIQSASRRWKALP